MLLIESQLVRFAGQRPAFSLCMWLQNQRIAGQENLFDILRLSVYLLKIHIQRMDFKALIRFYIAVFLLPNIADWQ